MNRIKQHLLIYFLAATSICNITAQQEESTFINYQEKVQTWLKSHKVPAVGIGVIEEGKLGQIMVFGDLKNNDHAPYNTIFEVASLTKPVTTMLALKLVSMDQWQLDEPLCEYWIDPDVADDPRHLSLTTRHVLTHQTGFDNWRRNTASKKLVFNFDPGTDYRYSGEGYEYLRRAMEHKFDRPMEYLADSLLFRPLKMKDTRSAWDHKIDASRFAVPHDHLGNIDERSLNESKNKHANDANFVKTTIEDYCKFR